MQKESAEKKKSFITEIKKKIRVLNSIAAFIVVVLLAVILRYLFEPFSEFMNFLPDVSVTVIIGIVLVLAIVGFSMWRAVTKQIIRSIKEYRERLDGLLHVTKDLRDEKHADILLGKIMNYALSLTRSDAGAVILAEGDALLYKTVTGDTASERTGKTIPRGKGIIGWVAENNTPVRIANAEKDERFDPDVDRMSGLKTMPVLSVPLKIGPRVIGVLQLLNKRDGSYTEQEEEIIMYLADQAASSIDRTKFYEDQKNYEIHVTDTLLETIDHQIPEKAGHSKRVAKYSNIMAKAINMSEDKQKRLYFASLLHDVGFLRIRSDVNYHREYYIKHPLIGYEMIQPINFYADIAPFILSHHERYDGSGYPQGLQGEDIPLEARIIAIAEAFDVMVSETSYKLPLSFDAALKELQRNAGTQFDFWLVDVFNSNIRPEHLD
jgi:putative methionine-R-sulfoxide reductase with GAF domain